MDSARKFWIASLLVWTFAITVLRGIGTPNDFAEAQWLVDYRFGFVKRGLMGALLQGVTAPFGIPMTPGLIAAVAAVIFAVYCVAILALTFRIVGRSLWRCDAVLVLLVFLSSPFVVMSAHLQGYFDHIVVLLGVLSLVLLLRGRPWAGALLQGLAVLVHENTMVLVFPAFCLAWLLGNAARQRESLPVLSFLPLCLPPLVVLAVAFSQSLTLDAQFIPKMTAQLAQYAFLGPERFADVPRWLATPFGDFLRQEGPKFVTRLTSTEMLSLMLPSLLALYVGTIVTFRIPVVSLEAALLKCLCLLPLVMHAIAWDTARIWTCVLLCAFLAYGVYAELVARAPLDERDGAQAGVVLLCLFALLFNVVLITPLMDARSDHFGLRTRLALYAPTFAGALLLLLQGSTLPLPERLRIQGRDLFSLLRLR